MATTDEDAWRAGVADALAALGRALAREIGPGETAQVDEYIAHHEFGLALELIVALAIRHGLDAGPYEAEVARLSDAMGMGDSEQLAEWRKRLGEA